MCSPADSGPDIGRAVRAVSKSHLKGANMRGLLLICTVVAVSRFTNAQHAYMLSASPAPCAPIQCSYAPCHYPATCAAPAPLILPAPSCGCAPAPLILPAPSCGCAPALGPALAALAPALPTLAPVIALSLSESIATTLPPLLEAALPTVLTSALSAAGPLLEAVLPLGCPGALPLALPAPLPYCLPAAPALAPPPMYAAPLPYSCCSAAPGCNCMHATICF